MSNNGIWEGFIMEKETKLMFGKILGEIYRIQRRLETDACPVRKSTVYALLNGIEPIIDEEFSRIGFISSDQYNNMCKVLDSYFYNEEKLAQFKGFYDIENELEDLGIDRADAIKILSYLKSNGSYTELIEKMDSQYSPMECKRFDLSDYDQ